MKYLNVEKVIELLQAFDDEIGIDDDYYIVDRNGDLVFNLNNEYLVLNNRVDLDSLSTLERVVIGYLHDSLSCVSKLERLGTLEEFQIKIEEMYKDSPLFDYCDFFEFCQDLINEKKDLIEINDVVYLVKE